MENSTQNIIDRYNKPQIVIVKPLNVAQRKELNIKFYNEVISYHCEEYGYYFRDINRTQIRVSDNRKTIDFYPKSGKFCRIPHNVWGLVGNDLPAFLKKEFDI